MTKNFLSVYLSITVIFVLNTFGLILKYLHIQLCSESPLGLLCALNLQYGSEKNRCSVFLSYYTIILCFSHLFTSSDGNFCTFVLKANICLVSKLRNYRRSFGWSEFTCLTKIPWLSLNEKNGYFCPIKEKVTSHQKYDGINYLINWADLFCCRSVIYDVASQVKGQLS